MNTKAKIVDPDEAWDAREVGADENFVEVASDINRELDSVLDLHPISIRLQKTLVENLKALAQLHGLGYQPLIRQVLTRWVDSELKQMVARHANTNAQAEVEGRAARAAGDAVKPRPPRQRKAA